MALSLSEKTDLFNRFKDKDVDRLRELSIIFKAHGNYEKARLADLLIKIKSQDIDGLKALIKELSRSGELMESVYADSLLQEKLSISAAEKKQVKEQKARDRLEKQENKTIPSFGVSEEIYEAMAKRISLNAQRHRDRIDGKADE
ncbi:MAG: hypothetical protein AB1724_19005 [Thermodesulfobacteriota bacterium]